MAGRSGIDPDRIGAFGFSAGGYTVLPDAGGRPDLALLADHCRQHPAFYDCTLLKAQPRSAAAAWPDLRDRRIKAIVVAAPALGFAFDRAGLGGVTIPVELWRADNDQILRTPLRTGPIIIAGRYSQGPMVSSWIEVSSVGLYRSSSRCW